VTGADGFIGSHLVEALVRNGYDVRAFVFYNSFNSWGWLDHISKEIKNSIDVYPGDIRDPLSVGRAVSGCRIVMHLAALISIPYSYRAPDSFIDTNIKGTLNILNASRDHQVDRVVHTSTSEVYGSARYVPINEEHPLHAQSPYAASKIAADQLAQSFHYSFGTPVVTIRPFNTYGPRQSARAVIPAVITQIASGRDTIKLGSLHPTRDFSYVEDTVAGFVAGAKASAAIGEVINIGSNFEISIHDTVKIISQVMGREIDIDFDDERERPQESEVTRLWADNSKAAELTGWRPLYSGKEGLSRGIQKTVQWFTNPENLKRYKADAYNY
jgi:NAD dependent epimerase/dehydratase